MEDILVPISLFTMIAVIVGTITYFRYRSQRESQETVRTLLQSGQPVSEENVRALVSVLNPGGQDLRRGVISFAVGVGIIALAFAVGDGEVVTPLLGVAAFPFFLGIAYFILWRLGEMREKGIG